MLVCRLYRSQYAQYMARIKACDTRLCTVNDRWESENDEMKAKRICGISGMDSALDLVNLLTF
jgi:hypothetical protein